MKKDKMMKTESLGGRLKGYEKEYEREIESDKHIVVRIDGHKFSKYTKGFKKPFDSILSKAFELTTIDLLEEFNAVTVYHQSGEDWNKISERYKSGIFVKKESFIKETFVEQQDIIVKAERSRIISLTKEELSFSQDNVDFIMKSKI